MSSGVLSRLGFCDSDSDVYQDLLKNGASKAGSIASRTGLNRVTVYKALNRLGDEGLVSHTVKAEGKEFRPTNPRVIEDLVKEKQSELEQIQEAIPDLQASYESSSDTVQPEIYEGIKGAKAVWERLLADATRSTEWLILGAPKKARRLGGYFKDFNERRSKQGVPMRIIYNDNAEDLIEERQGQGLVDVRVMPPEYLTPASIEVVDETVLLVLYAPVFLVFSIENAEVANSFRQYFDLLWHQASEP